MEKLIYEYCLLKYVPDIERGEFINIGLMMMCKRVKWLKSDILINEEKIKALSFKSNIDLLRNQAKLFLCQDAPSPNIPIEEKYRWLASVKSAIIQTSPSHPGILMIRSNEPNLQMISELLDCKFNDLFNTLVK